ncbi:cytochrome-c oxidase, cbb3-type subunit II [Rubricoccus marinus]|uniref:Cytochrome-c oxidase, cbb3-type subunit II n=1 Tax=Rubricoccus marinus TaxID=716817 RepID=A0A259TXK7_9BACT|nr:cytochrome-c oxidase, cbb3-type subunit II [Rubricoccus marinus]OZC02441.1 cytochrome-c oxidase, cbb3-type subunit II [Rubricoccus marinus]
MFNRLIRANGRHRRLEGWPLVFTILTTGAILVGTVVEFAPVFLVGGATEPLATVHPPTPLELAGRDLYIREGCNNCHSQMVRPFRQEEIRYGPYTRAAETVYETPHLWGSKRTGPDLMRVGGKYPHLWHVRHMENPRSTSPASIMPPYPHMLTRETDFESLPGKMRGLRRLGLPYTDAEIENAVALAQAQADSIAADVVAQGGPDRLARKEIIALTAYLQRLGTEFDGSPAEEDRELHEEQEAIEVLTDAATPEATPAQASGAAPSPRAN